VSVYQYYNHDYFIKHVLKVHAIKPVNYLNLF